MGLTSLLLAAMCLVAIYFLMLGSYKRVVVQIVQRLHHQTKTQTASVSKNPQRIQAVSISAHTLPVQERLYLHVCPACGTKHFVNAVRHRFAYGTQLACSTGCEIQRRKQSESGSLW